MAKENEPSRMIESFGKDKRMYFQIPDQYKSSVLTLAKLEYEKERTSEKFEYNAHKDDKWYASMRNRIISDNCNQIAATHNDEQLAELNRTNDERLKELRKLEPSKTNSLKYTLVHKGPSR